MEFEVRGQGSVRRSQGSGVRSWSSELELEGEAFGHRRRPPFLGTDPTIANKIKGLTGSVPNFYQGPGVRSWSLELELESGGRGQYAGVRGQESGVRSQESGNDVARAPPPLHYCRYCHAQEITNQEVVHTLVSCKGSYLQRSEIP